MVKLPQSSKPPVFKPIVKGDVDSWLDWVKILASVGGIILMASLWFAAHYAGISVKIFTVSFYIVFVLLVFITVMDMLKIIRRNDG